MGGDAVPYLAKILDSEDTGLYGVLAARILGDIAETLDPDDDACRSAKAALVRWNVLAEKTRVFGRLPEFAEEEVASARAVVEEY
jgi:hypothetical protein